MDVQIDLLLKKEMTMTLTQTEAGLSQSLGPKRSNLMLMAMKRSRVLRNLSGTTSSMKQ